MKKLTLKVISERFTKLYPYGRITKLSNIAYEIYFDARDERTEVEHEMANYYGIKTDTRKCYTYKVNHLKELADRLKINVDDILDSQNEYNKDTSEPSANPFFESLFGKKRTC